ncbi:efflux RND transporter periplasmic adaptor subunit [Agrobacterium vitis]
MRLYRPTITLPFLLALTLAAGCSQEDDQQAAGPRPVRSMTVKAERLSGVSFAGVVQARVETDLAFRTLGRVILRKAEVGDLVHKGDVVAEIDPLALQFAVNSAEADLRNAQAAFENAQITEKRRRTLATINAGSVADFEVAEQGLKSAQASLDQANAKLDKAREQLGYARLQAEFDGVVTSVSVEVGQTVTAGQTVMKVARLDQRDVIVDVPEGRIGALKEGTKFNVALQLDPTKQAIGTLREIGPEADAETRTHRLKIAINDAPEVFRLGAVVTATASRDEEDGVILLPLTAILRKDGATGAWVIDRANATVALRKVVLDDATTDGNRVKVLSGLKEGEQVAVAGANQLAEGQKIKTDEEPRP